MLASFYIKSYYTWLKDLYSIETLEVGNEFPTFVPDGTIQSMMAFTGRKYFYDRSDKDKNDCPKQPTAFMGFTRGVINNEPLRQNRAIRGVPGGTGATSRKMTRATFELNTFIVTSDDRLAEDFEEIYNVIVRDFSTIPVDLTDIIPEQASDEFSMNAFHRPVIASTQHTEMGNIWGIEMPVEITSSFFQLTREEKVRLKKLSICLFTNPATITGKVEQLYDV